jgi:hypothetical protein
MNVEKRPCKRIAIYPRELTKFGLALSTGNVGMDDQSELWPIYEAILNEQDTWRDDRRPLVMEEMEETRGKHEGWMEEAKLIAVGSFMLVLEDGPDVCNSESSAEYSDHGEEWAISDMYTPDMLNEKGQPILDRARMTEDQVRRIRERRAGGSGTVSGAGRQET